MTPEATREEGIRRMQSPKTLEEVQRYAVGTWESLSVELRPRRTAPALGRPAPHR